MPRADLRNLVAGGINYLGFGPIERAFGLFQGWYWALSNQSPVVGRLPQHIVCHRHDVPLGQISVVTMVATHYFYSQISAAQNCLDDIDLMATRVELKVES